MTTIAYDGRYIAADGRCTLSDVIIDDNTHKFYTNQVTGDIFALCGDMTLVQKFADDFTPRKDIDFDINCSGIKITKDGLLYVVNYEKVKHEDKWRYWEMLIPSSLTKYAAGSGREYALSSLDLGCSAEQAIESASKRDIYTGGKITVYDSLHKKFVNA